MKITHFISGTIICGGIALLIFALLNTTATTEIYQESQFCYLENADSLEISTPMAVAQVLIFRTSETSDAVTMQFNEESSRLLGKKDLKFEETSKGVLITTATVDAHLARKITFKKRKLNFYIKEDFKENQWCPVVKIDKETFLVEIDFED